MIIQILYYVLDLLKKNQYYMFLKEFKEAKII